ncbi:AraC family transcriptional regulator [Caballeronia cordobensis]|uniref:AraC family transcriptional regulator n=2 Tax=Caballeronia cordobensis TaxID=1353886 RepID=A0A158I2Y3_CABCO|nr:AraC family transcriptional regulator [Caballeronia cordobensis]
MDRVSPHIPNQAKFWREPAFGSIEMLQATYRTHRFPPHAHDEFAFGIIERGAQAYLDARGHRLVMPERTICVINPGNVHEGRPALEGGWDYRMMYVPTADLTSMLNRERRPLIGTLHFSETVIDDPQTMRLLYDAHRCSESTDIHPLEKASRLTAALFQLVQRHAQTAPRTDVSTLLPGAVKRAREYIDAHFVENPTLDAIAAVAGMSSYQLIRAFKHAVGMAPHAYLVQRRVAMAKQLLLRGQPLRQVAIEVGYCDQGHLTREFRRFFGVPPSRSRRQ